MAVAAAAFASGVPYLLIDRSGSSHRYRDLLKVRIVLFFVIWMEGETAG